MSGPPPPVDWSAGRYETFAEQLAPIAAHVITLAAPAAGETLLDVACGTGNAALLAARGGADVIGIDSAVRLIDVAEGRAEDAGLTARFVVGDAQVLAFDANSFDIVVSVMGIIFAPDARRALGEVMRVLRPGGRAFLSAWRSGGAVDAMVGAMMSEMARVLGPPPPRFAWGDPDAVRPLAADLGATVRFHEGTLAFAAESAEAFLAEQENDHPSSQWAAQVLAERGVDSAPMHEAALAAIRAHNEDPAAFRTTSSYHVIELRPA